MSSSASPKTVPALTAASVGNGVGEDDGCTSGEAVGLPRIVGNANVGACHEPGIGAGVGRGRGAPVGYDEPEDEDAREAGDLDEEDEFHDAMDGDE